MTSLWLEPGPIVLIFGICETSNCATGYGRPTLYKQKIALFWSLVQRNLKGGLIRLAEP